MELAHWQCLYDGSLCDLTLLVSAYLGNEMVLTVLKPNLEGKKKKKKVFWSRNICYILAINCLSSGKGRGGSYSVEMKTCASCESAPVNERHEGISSPVFLLSTADN